MQTFLFCLLWTGHSPITTFTIENVRAITPEYNGDVSDEFLMVARLDKSLHLMDHDFRIWIVDFLGNTVGVYGGRGEAPGEFKPFFSGFYGYGERVIVLHSTGKRSAIFDLKGKLLETKNHQKYMAFFGQEAPMVRLRTMSIGRFSSPIEVFTKDHLDGIPLVSEEDDDVIPIFSFRMTVSGEFGLIHNAHGIHQRVYFALFHLKDGTLVDHDSVNMTDRRISTVTKMHQEDRPRGRILPMILGSTSSPELGFVLTEHTVPQDFRILKIMNPATKNWSAYKLMLGKYANATHFTHLGENRWAALSGTEVIFFDLVAGKTGPK